MIFFFFFLICNKDIYSRTLPYAEKHKVERKVQREKKEKKEKRKEKILITQERAKEHRERITRCESQFLEQSNREPLKEANSWLAELSISSNVLLFRSLQRHHIKHNGAKFQMLDKCFRGQFHQPNRVSATDLGRTQENPKDLNIKLHNR